MNAHARNAGLAPEDCATDLLAIAATIASLSKRADDLWRHATPEARERMKEVEAALDPITPALAERIRDAAHKMEA